MMIHLLDENVQFCNFDDIVCETNEVTLINLLHLYHMDLSGTIPTSIALLEGLQTINLSNNDLGGSVLYL